MIKVGAGGAGLQEGLPLNAGAWAFIPFCEPFLGAP
jgi:hypothetical protein